MICYEQTTRPEFQMTVLDRPYFCRFRKTFQRRGVRTTFYFAEDGMVTGWVSTVWRRTPLTALVYRSPSIRQVTYWRMVRVMEGR